MNLQQQPWNHGEMNVANGAVTYYWNQSNKNFVSHFSVWMFPFESATLLQFPDLPEMMDGMGFIFVSIKKKSKKKETVYCTTTLPSFSSYYQVVLVQDCIWPFSTSSSFRFLFPWISSLLCSGFFCLKSSFALDCLSCFDSLPGERFFSCRSKVTQLSSCVFNVSFSFFFHFDF